jgi:SAM-dependent methyltransferase
MNSDKASPRAVDNRLRSADFPLSSNYHPDWIIANAMGSHVLWLTEWLAGVMNFQPRMRVLDLGCGRALSSVFLAREFDVEVWATDLWVSAAENWQRIQDAGLSDRIVPLHADARSLPFAADFFDAVVSVDAFSYFGTDSLYLNYLANFVRPGGHIGIAGAGLVQEFETVPPHLQAMWTQDFWSLHSADWWRRHWERTRIVDVQLADTMVAGWQKWLEWQTTAHPENNQEIETVQLDRGRYLGYMRVVGRRRADAQLVDYCWPDPLRTMIPPSYQRVPLLRDGAPAAP